MLKARISRREDTPLVAMTSDGWIDVAGLNFRLMNWDVAFGRSGLGLLVGNFFGNCEQEKSSYQLPRRWVHIPVLEESINHSVTSF
jgi:hypothetical protein